MGHLFQKKSLQTQKKNSATGLLAYLRRPSEIPDFRRMQLGLESLESRSLMAVAAMGSDITGSLPTDNAVLATMQSPTAHHGPLHNSDYPEDVDNDGECTA